MSLRCTLLRSPRDAPPSRRPRQTPRGPGEARWRSRSEGRTRTASTRPRSTSVSPSPTSAPRSVSSATRAARPSRAARDAGDVASDVATEVSALASQLMEMDAEALRACCKPVVEHTRRLLGVTGRRSVERTQLVTLLFSLSRFLPLVASLEDRPRDAETVLPRGSEIFPDQPPDLHGSSDRHATNDRHATYDRRATDDRRATALPSSRRAAVANARARRRSSAPPSPPLRTRLRDPRPRTPPSASPGWWRAFARTLPRSARGKARWWRRWRMHFARRVSRASTSPVDAFPSPSWNFARDFLMA